jgi:RNA polymerase sigma factor (sigma-70 family)
MNLLYVLLFLFFIKNITSLHLNNFQIKIIKSAIQNPELSLKQREKINYILYKAYEKWSISKAIEFKSIHKHKCSNIKLEELVFASKIGLFKSLQKYNGKYDLINYSSIYIKSELLKVLTDAYSSSILPKNIRKKNKSNMTKTEQFKYNFLLEVKPIVSYEQWKSDLIFQNKEKTPNQIFERKETLNDLLNELLDNQHSYSDFTKRVIYLKYFFYKNKIPSNKHISELMCCSEETVRQELLKVKQIKQPTYTLL